MAIVIFNPTDFKLQYPEFNSVSDAVLNRYFNEATLYLANTNSSIVRNLDRRTTLLYMLVAHLAVLGGAISSDGQVRTVGAVTSASQGSVSISYDTGSLSSGNKAWFAQTQYGISFWQATVELRSFKYMKPATTAVY